jgi:hypothetical protein
MEIFNPVKLSTQKYKNLSQQLAPTKGALLLKTPKLKPTAFDIPKKIPVANTLSSNFSNIGNTPT